MLCIWQTSLRPLAPQAPQSSSQGSQQLLAVVQEDLKHWQGDPVIFGTIGPPNTLSLDSHTELLAMLLPNNSGYPEHYWDMHLTQKYSGLKITEISTDS